VAAVAGAAPAEAVDSQLDHAMQPELPRITKIRICRVIVAPSKIDRRTAGRSTVSSAIEFIVETDGEVPVRSYGPALFVGDVEINHSERIRARTWRLLAFEPERLMPGSLIAWGWMKARASERVSTSSRYVVEREAHVCAAVP
jgi:hypothetical protein